MKFFDQGTRLRQLIDERYTASSLLGLSQALSKRDPDQVQLKPSSSVCENYYAEVMTENNWVRDSNGAPLHSSTGVKRVRRSGKYTQQERETIR